MPAPKVSARGSIRWVALSQGSRVGCQIVMMVVLARLLTPQDFGVVALATVVTNLANIVRDMGTAAALIQKKELSPELIVSTFWFNLAFGAGLCVLVLAAAPVMALMFDLPALHGVLSALSIAFPIASSAAVHQALLERASQFRKLALIEASGAVVAVTIAIPAANAGAGPYSLVLYTLSTAAFAAIALWIVSSWRPSGRWSGQAFAEIKTFSTRIAGFSLVNYLSRNLDAIIIGKLLGPTDLGAYSLAYRVMLFPVQNLTFVLNRALFPVLSRRHAEEADIAGLYLRTVSGIAFVSAPLMAGLWALREPFCALAFGPQWPDLPVLVAWLAPVGFVQSIVSSTGPVFMAKGRTGLLLVLGIVGALLFAIAFVIGGRLGLESVVIGYLMANLINATICLPTAIGVLGVRLGRLVSAILLPMALALAMAAVVRMTAMTLSANGYSTFEQLLIGAVIGLSFFSVIARLFAVRQITDLARMVR